MSLEAVRNSVLERVMPEDAEREANQELFGRIKAFIAEAYELDARLMGSTAKGTFIAGDKDLDIFVFFDTDVPEENLEERGLEIGKAVFEQFDGEYRTEYADHPYTKGVIEGYDVEIVPAYAVDSGADIRSAVDRTPFHTEWVNDRLDADEKADVVMLKAFLRGQGLYGSTLKVEGFSGYLCELLIEHYGSFAELIGSAQVWDEREVIDVADHHGDTLPVVLADKFEHDALIVIDPVDPERNVAAVLSDENYARFVHACWRFDREPTTEMVFPQPVTAAEDGLTTALEDRGVFITVSFPTPDGLVDDILYPQLRRLQRRIEQELRANQYTLMHTAFYVGEEVRMVFELPYASLPPTRKQHGPQVFHGNEHIASFVDKYETVWVEGAHLTTIVEREHLTAVAVLEDLLSGDLQGAGVPKQLTDPVSERTIQTGLPMDGDDWRSFLSQDVHL